MLLDLMRTRGIQVYEHELGGDPDPEDIEARVNARIENIVDEKISQLEDRGEGPAFHFVEEDDDGEGYVVYGPDADRDERYDTQEQADVAERLNAEALSQLRTDIENNLDRRLH
jgi:hypothetical protein